MADALKPAWMSRKAWHTLHGRAVSRKEVTLFYQTLNIFWIAEEHHITSRDTSGHQLHGVYDRTRFVFHQIDIFIAFSKRWSLFLEGKEKLWRNNQPSKPDSGNKNNKELYKKHLSIIHIRSRDIKDRIFSFFTCKVKCVQTSTEWHFHVSYSGH